MAKPPQLTEAIHRALRIRHELVSPDPHLFAGDEVVRLEDSGAMGERGQAE